MSLRQMGRDAVGWEGHLLSGCPQQHPLAAQCQDGSARQMDFNSNSCVTYCKEDSGNHLGSVIDY